MVIDNKLDFFFFLADSPWILSFVGIIIWQDIYNSRTIIMFLYPYISFLGIQLQLWMMKTTTV